MRSIEYKAELRDPSLARTIATGLGASFILETDQTDTYYRVTTGRLKRRESPDEPVEYILYDRSETTIARASEYTILSEMQARERFGEAPLPQHVVVKKHRVIFMMANVRIHLDTVSGLGSFFELEALITRECDDDMCLAAINRLRQAFAPALGGAIASSYADMVALEEETHQRAHEPPRGP